VDYHYPGLARDSSWDSLQTNLLARCPLCYSTISVTVLIALHIIGMQIGRAWLGYDAVAT